MDRNLFVRAPLRIDFSGGPSDVPPFCDHVGGAVISAAINLYAFASISAIPSGYEIISDDYEQTAFMTSLEEIPPQESLKLVTEILKFEHPSNGIRLQTRSQAPPGSGLGASASISVATIAALRLLQDSYSTQVSIAETAIHIERNILSILGGCQDQYISALGGFQYIEVNNSRIATNRLDIKSSFISKLEASSILCYTGRSRVSGDIQLDIMKRFQSNDQKTINLLENLRDLAYIIKEYLLDSNIEGIGRSLLDDWHYRSELHPAVAIDECNNLMNIALSCGALGGKVLGAGGGGCMYFIADFYKIETIKRKFEEIGILVLPFSFVDHGLQWWT
jgi:D-glycero-alpha-D-manno-heptose-7-phosphate kinase